MKKIGNNYYLYAVTNHLLLDRPFSIRKLPFARIQAHTSKQKDTFMPVFENNLWKLRWQ